MRPAVLLLATLFAGSAVAQFNYPAGPQSTRECDQVHERANDLARQHHARGEQLLHQRDATDAQLSAACRPLIGSRNDGYWRCREPYAQRSSEYGRLAGEAFHERDRIEREARGPWQQCLQVARANEQRVAEQRRMAEAQQRQQLQTRQEAERRQQEALAHQNAEMQRMQAQQHDRQPRVIAGAQTSAPQRNEAHIVLPASAHTTAAVEQRAQQAQDAARVQQAYEAAQTGKALRDLYDVAKDARKVQAEGASLEILSKYAYNKEVGLVRSSLDAQLNPRGYRDPGVQLAVTTAQEANSQINKARIGGPDATVISSISNTSIGAVGSVANDALRQLSSLDELSAPASGAGAAIAAPASAVPASSLDDLAMAPAPSPSPADACKALGAAPDRDQCLAAQCKLPQFASHDLCRNSNR